MFGYIKAYQPELKMREYEYYRAAYCGLCRSMGKCCGTCSRMTLSYDMVFVLLVRMAIAGIEPEFEQGRCALHPFKKRMFMKINPELQYTARAATVLAYEKCADDISDEKGARKAASVALRAFLKKGKKRAAESTEMLSEDICEGLSRLHRLEAENEASVDIPADVFGDMMARVMSYGYTGSRQRLAADIGKRAGRWVYITDAADDCESDMKKGRYNPLLALYGKVPTAEQKEVLGTALDCELAAIRRALDLVDREDRRDLFEILENILDYGMVASGHKAIYGKDSEK